MKYILLLGRILFAAIFIMAVPGLFDGQTFQMAGNNGVPYPNILVPLAGIIALLGGLSLLLGYKGRAGAWLLVIFLVPVTVVMHKFWAASDPMAAQMQQIMFMKNVAMLGGALFIAYFGTGPLSIDSWLRAAHLHGHEAKAAGPVTCKFLWQ